MNKKCFKKNMMQGLGSCYVTLKEKDNIDKYKNIVLWGCLHNLSYDTQCEGTRTSYVYRLTNFFNDEEYFVNPIIDKIYKTSPKNDWLCLHYIELLQNFAKDGNMTAKNALNELYIKAFNKLMIKKYCKRYDYDRDYFEHLAISLFYIDEINLEKIIRDMERLFIYNPFYSFSDFDYFSDVIIDNIGIRKFKSYINNNSYLSSFFKRSHDEFLEEDELEINHIKKTVFTSEDLINEIVVEGNLSPVTRVRFRRTADIMEKEKLAKMIIVENDLNIKAKLLSVFDYKECFPLSHEYLIEWSKSDNKELKDVSIMALTNCKSDTVKDYALSLLNDEEYKFYAIEMLIFNFKLSHKDLLLNEINKIKIGYKEDDWHSIVFKILDSYELNIRLPKEYYLYIYDNSLCSCCRESALRILAKHRWLTKDMIEECRYDSNAEIVRYINRYY